MEELNNKLTETKIKLLDTIYKKLEDEDITSEDLKNISSAISNIKSFSDYMDKLYPNIFGFGGCATSEDKININKGD